MELENFPVSSGITVADFGDPDDFQTRLEQVKTSKRYRSVFLTRLLDYLKEALQKGTDGESDARDLLELMRICANYDDVSASLAQVLGEIIIYLDRIPSLVRELLKVIDALSMNVDPAVVQTTCSAFSELIFLNSNKELFVDGIVPLVFHFAESAYASPRAASALLLHCVYEFLTEEDEKEMIVSFFFSQLCFDVDVVVRRFCAVALPEWALILDQAAMTTMLPIISSMSKDEDHDSIRVQLVNSLPEIMIRIPSARGEFLRFVVDCAQDPSWRVRYSTGRHLGEFSSSLSATSLAPSIVLLARDQEREVRAVVASSMASICENVSSGDLNQFLELTVNFAHDESPVVRSALASVVCSITSMAPKDLTDNLLATVLRLLQETDTVKLQLIPSVWKLGPRLLSEEQIGKKLCEVLLSARQHRQWRLREATAKLLRHFSQHLNLSCYSDLVLESLGLVIDDVADVRKAMVATLATMSRQLGGKWSLKTLQDLLPESLHKNYRHRQAFASCLEVMLPFLDDKTDELGFIKKCLTTLARDKVPNVRMKIAQALSNAMVPKDLADLRVELLNELNSDPDAEVVAAASRNSVSDAPF